MGAIQIILLLLILCVGLVALGRLRRQTKAIEDLQRCLGRHPNMPPTVITPKPVDYPAPQHDRPHDPPTTSRLLPTRFHLSLPPQHQHHRKPPRLATATNAPKAAP